MCRELLTIDISRGSAHDGPGLRTTVFTKGCPLHCRWCQNPESIGVKNEPWWEKHSCIGCRLCLSACPQKALSADQNGIRIDRTRCEACGRCAEICPCGAMSFQGQTYDGERLLREVLRDRLYYEQFGGGVTCSGGEPLLQYGVVAEFFRALKAEGIHTALDTSGAVPLENLQAVLPWTDLVLYDLKLFDAAEHKKWTGATNERILQNLLWLAGHAAREGRPKLWIRTPLIPGATADEKNIKEIGTFLSENMKDVVERWELCTFNGLCVSKYGRLGIPWEFDGVKAMTGETVTRLWRAAVSAMPEERVFASGMTRSSSAE